MRFHFFRPLVKKPVPVLTTVLCLGLGIGVNTALFSVLNYLVLSPLNVPRPDQLVMVYPASENGSYPDLEFYAQENDTLSALFGERFVELSVEISGTPERAIGALVTANYFSGLGVTPVAGNLLGEERGEPLYGRERGVLVSESLWRDRLDRDLGRRVRINGRSLPVLGVVPGSFHGTFAGLEPRIWIPLGLAPELFPGEDFLSRRSLHFLGRLRESTELAAARDNLNTLFERRRREASDTFEGWGQFRVEAFSRLPREFQVPILGFLGLLGLISAMVLLLTCVNAANLLLARLFEDRRETALRVALGAPRRRLYLNSIAENLLVSNLGCLCGVLVAQGVLGFLERLVSALPVPLATRFELDWRVLLFAWSLALLTGLALGLIPLARVLQEDPLNSLRERSGSATASLRTSRWRGLLVTAQVSLSVALLMLAGLFLRSLQQAGSVDPGFQVDRHLILQVSATGGSGDPQEIRSFYGNLVDWLESQPEVVSAAVAHLVPLSLENSSLGVVLEGTDIGEVQHNVIGPDYFKTLEIPIRLGRAFTRHDSAGNPLVAVVNETMAHSLWPGRSPLGKVFSLRGFEGMIGPIAVVGVARDSHYITLGEEPRSFFYLPFAQNISNDMNVHIQTRVEGRRERGSLERSIREWRPDIAFTLTTMQEQLGIAYFLPRALASLLGGFGLLGLMLTLLGVYGIVAFFVSQSQRELGIRMSLGGRPRHILALILRRGAASVALGTLLGLASSVPLAGLVRSLLYGVSPLDPTLFLAVASVLAIATLAASAGPAWRALRLDPVRVLKAE